MKKILGFDISSSTIGYGLIGFDDVETKIIEYGHLKPPGSEKGSLAFRALSASKMLKELLLKINPDYVAFEDYANRFSEGRSSARTIIVLSVFNETSSMTCLETLGFEPIKYPAVTIRSSLSKIKGDKITSKEDAFDFICKNYPDFKLKYKKTGKIKDECFDEADAIAVALTFLNKEKK
jgi:Holliday junction resolvasome RuvABC endonuclease subunit